MHAPYLNMALTLLIVSTLLLSSFACAESSFRQRLNHLASNEVTKEDITAEINFGHKVAARVLGRYGLLDDLELNHYINLVGGVVSRSSSRPELDYYFAVLDSEHINAYSAPGGYIFVTRGALLAMRNEAELAAVLAHEVAHITERDIVKTLNIRARENDGSAGLGRLIGGANASMRVAVNQALDGAIAILFETGYRQEDELVADQVAMMLLALAGYQPSALQSYLTRIAKSEPENAAGSTHPPTRARMRQLQQLSDEEQLHAREFKNQQQRFESYVQK